MSERQAHHEGHPPATFAPLPRDELVGLSGLEVLRRMLDGRLPLPPFGATLDIVPVEVSEGRMVFAGRPAAAFQNPMGTVHGGWIAAILDSAMGCAVHSTLKAGQSYTTTSLTLNYVRSLLPGGVEVRCEASALFSGKRTATAEGRLLDADGRLIAHGTQTCLILDAPPPSGASVG
ncbi:PaaI family thioesterase [Antarcticirhabdus aurantiaca]|uniref:PaaI family thioesterase n=1 Tax=Antarcticirhabdus aurantiaca TaxID=2606717 RepID=A0ACD4NQ33_9HYPH|nr:PaaI family thioesterase [Antarcticirhabdus aurantiaca]WAJ28864.1 PaaI family thioesterase [Jeongeuplla avenae]